MPEQTDKRDNILHTTLHLIVERGLESTPMSLIASEAAVGMGTIYHLSLIHISEPTRPY